VREGRAPAKAEVRDRQDGMMVRHLKQVGEHAGSPRHML